MYIKIINILMHKCINTTPVAKPGGLFSAKASGLVPRQNGRPALLLFWKRFFFILKEFLFNFGRYFLFISKEFLFYFGRGSFSMFMILCLFLLSSWNPRKPDVFSQKIDIFFKQESSNTPGESFPTEHQSMWSLAHLLMWDR